MEILARWWADPQASSTICLAIIAGAYALYQLRAVPADRRRRVLDGMTTNFAKSNDARGVVLKQAPPLLELGLRALRVAVEVNRTEANRAVSMLSPEELLSTPKQERRVSLEQELDDWHTDSLGISYFSAAEIMQSDVKFRALLWSIETIRVGQAIDGAQVPGRGVVGDPEVITAKQIAAVKDLVTKMNNFLADYESGVFPARQMLGVWHVTLARLTAASAPFIWERSLPRVGETATSIAEGDARWGRRILRVGIAANHFNDINRRHRTSAIIWTPKENAAGVDSVVVHPRLSKEMLGAEILIAGSPGSPKVLPYMRYWFRERYWSLIGALALRPRGRFTSYGGLRLARHNKKEAELTTLLRFAMERGRQLNDRYSLSLDWDLRQLKEEIGTTRKTAFKAASKFRLHWIYMGSSSQGKR